MLKNKRSRRMPSFFQKCSKDPRFISKLYMCGMPMMEGSNWRTQGIDQYMYNSKCYWNGGYDIVYYMSGVDILGINKMGPRFLQAYCGMNLFPDGVEVNRQWA
eukprot:12728573-Prorocentrum_lima.AAC.1